MLCAIPIEIANRELDGVIYLALHLAKRGLPTLFGERMVNEYVFRLHEGKPVLYFDQDQSVPTNNKVLAAGGAVFNLNNEGLIMEDSLAQGIYGQVVPSVTKMCLWGDKQAEIVGKHLPQGEERKIVVTGHPSFDLLGEKMRVYYRDEEIIREHGEDFILINTNFSLFNMKMDLKRYIRMLGRMEEWEMYKKPEVQADLWAANDYQRKVYDEFIKLIRLLSRTFPNRHIIVRPHPMEKQETYTNVIGDLPNVFVTGNRSVRRWIFSASCVIHHDCTTGLEALLMDKLVIGFRPVFEKARTCYLQANMGVHTTSSDEVVDLIRQGTMGKAETERQLALVRPFIANLRRNAAETVAGLAVSEARPEAIWTPEPLGLVESVKCWRKHLSKLIRSRQPGHNGRKVRYALEKFPRLPFSHIQGCVERFTAIDPTLANMNLKELALNTYYLEPKS